MTKTEPLPSRRNPKRIVVIGGSCSGKTTFASRLAKALQIRHVELDALHWEPNWKEADRDIFRSRVQKAVDTDSWIVDGNYTSRIRDLVWTKADTFIWLDPPLRTVLSRFAVRSVTRCLKGELLWGHSKETFKNNLFSRHSLLVWILKTHRKRTKAYLKLVNEPPTGAKVYRLRNQKQIAEFFQSLHL